MAIQLFPSGEFIDRIEPSPDELLQDVQLGIQTQLKFFIDGECTVKELLQYCIETLEEIKETHYGSSTNE